MVFGADTDAIVHVFQFQDGGERWRHGCVAVEVRPILTGITGIAVLPMADREEEPRAPRAPLVPPVWSVPDQQHIRNHVAHVQRSAIARAVVAEAREAEASTSTSASALASAANSSRRRPRVGLAFDPRMAKHRPLPETAYDSAWDRGVLTTQSPPGALIQFGGAVGTNERPERILATIQALEEGGILDLCVAVPCREARDDEIRLVHTAEHVDGLARLSAQSSSTSSESSGGGSAATGGSTAGSGETKEGTTGETVATRTGVQSWDTDKQPTRILAYGDSLTAGYWRNGMGEWAPYVDAIGERFPTVSCSHVGMSGWGTVQMVEAMQEEEVQCCCGRTWAGLLVALKRERGEGVEGKGEGSSPSSSSSPYSPRPPLVLIMAGTNDLGDVQADAIVDNLAQLHAAVHAAGSRTVALSIPEHGQEGELAFIRETRLAVNQRLEEMALANPQWMHFVDAAAIVPVDDGTRRDSSGAGGATLSAELGVGGASNSELWDDLLHMTPNGYTALGRGVAMALQGAGVLTSL